MNRGVNARGVSPPVTERLRAAHSILLRGYGFQHKMDSPCPRIDVPARMIVATAPCSPSLQVSPVQGQLGAKLVTDLIREIAQKQHNGLLRLTRGKTIKAIFFENGEPKFAISNLTGEQLDHLLVNQSLVTSAQLEAAKARAGKVPRLASELVDMGIIGSEAMRKAVREQVMAIILSLFEWTQ